MSPEDIKKIYPTSHVFEKKTGMSHNSYQNWFKWGFVPLQSQCKLQALTNGALVAELHDFVNREWRKKNKDPKCK